MWFLFCCGVCKFGKLNVLGVCLVEVVLNLLNKDDDCNLIKL